MLELKLPPLALAAVLAAAMWLVGRLAPSLDFSFPGHRLVVTAAAVMGMLIGIAGVLAFRRARTTVDPRFPARAEALVIGGIYRVSRNPMYVATLLLLTAWAMHVANLLAVLALPAFVLYLNRFQIVPEERALLAKFGSQYLEYQRTVRRWL